MSLPIPPLNFSLADTGSAISGAEGKSTTGEKVVNFNIAAPGSNSGVIWLVGAAIAAFLIVRR